MKCHYCGTEITGNEIFCRHCGTRLQGVFQPEPVAIEEAPAPVQEIPAEPVAVEPVPAPRPAPVYEEKTFGWQPYGAPIPEEPLFDFEKSAAPAIQLPVKRSLWKMILFSILTFGIYPMVIWSRLTGEVNMVASRHDGERSMSFFGMMMLSPITLGIHSLVWIHKLCRRIGAELHRRSIPYHFGAKDFWIWNVLVGFISTVCYGVAGALYATGTRAYVIMWLLLFAGTIALAGPFEFIRRLMKSMNKLNADFNVNG